MSNNMVKINFDFDGKKMPVIVFKGTPCWIAKDVGNALGYADGGSRLVETINKDWADELIAGQDYIKLQGKDLKDFKNMLKLPTGSVGSSGHTRNLILLTESGVNLCCMKTSKPIGKMLRRWLSDDVLPSIARTGGYGQIAASGSSDLNPVSQVAAMSPAQQIEMKRLIVAEMRERRLYDQGMATIKLRQMKEERLWKQNEYRIKSAEEKRVKRLPAGKIDKTSRECRINGVENKRVKMMSADKIDKTSREYRDLLAEYPHTDFGIANDLNLTPYSVACMANKIFSYQSPKQHYVGYRFVDGDRYRYSRAAYDMIKIEYNRKVSVGEPFEQPTRCTDS